MTSRGAWTTSIPVSSCGGGGEVAMCPSIARAWAAWQERSYFLSVVSFTSFLTSFLVARACFLALRIFLFAWRFVFSAPLSVCSASFALSVALAAVSLTSFTLSLSANAGSARPMASAAIIPFNMFSFPFSGRPMGRRSSGKVRTGRSVHNGAEDHPTWGGLPVLRLVAGGGVVDRLLGVGGLACHVAGTRRHAWVLVRPLVVGAARCGRPRYAARRCLIGRRGAGTAARVGRGARRGALVVRRFRSSLGLVSGRRVGGRLRAVHVSRATAALRRLTLLRLLALRCGRGIHLGRALVADAGRGRCSALARLRARRVVAIGAVVRSRLGLLRLGVSGRRLVGRRVVAGERAVARRGVGRVAGQGAAVLVAREDGGALVLGRLLLWGGRASSIRVGLRARRERGEREGQRGRRDDLRH